MDEVTTAEEIGDLIDRVEACGLNELLEAFGPDMTLGELDARLDALFELEQQRLAEVAELEALFAAS